MRILRDYLFIVSHFFCLEKRFLKFFKKMTQKPLFVTDRP